MTSTDNPSSSPTVPDPAGIDPRGPRFGAGITAILLVAVLLLGALSNAWPAVILLGLITLSFAIGALRGPQGTWQGAIYAKFVQPRLSPTAEREDPRPPTFAQLVGFVITGIGLILGIAAASGLWPAAAIAVPIAAAFALIAAFLNSVFGFCLGCEIYLLIQRLRPART